MGGMAAESAIKGRRHAAGVGKSKVTVEVDGSPTAVRVRDDGTHQQAELEAAVEALHRRHAGGERGVAVLRSDNDVLAGLARKPARRRSDSLAELWREYDEIATRFDDVVWRRTDAD